MARPTHATETESKINGSEPKPNGTATDPTDEERTVEALGAEANRNPGAYRESAHVYRAQDGAPQRQGGWVTDIPLAQIQDARIAIAKHKDGGRGVYQVVLLDAATGKRSRVAFLRIDSDMRAPAEEPARRGDDALAFLREELAKRNARIDALESRGAVAIAAPRSHTDDVIDRMQARLDTANDRANKSFSDGYETGFKQGQIIGALQGEAQAMLKNPKRGVVDDPWTPGDVKGIVSEVGKIFASKPTAPGAVTSTDDVQLFDIVKRALELGISARNTVEMVRTLRGETIYQWLVQNFATIVQNSVQTPEFQALMQVPNAETWFHELQSVLVPGVASANAGP